MKKPNQNTRHRATLVLTGCLLAMAVMAQSTKNDVLDLSGMWRFQLDPMGFGKTPGSGLYLDKLSETIMLPGSTDQGDKGIKNTARYVDRLSRKFEYQGAVWYQWEVVIPEGWSDCEIYLKLECCHWETTVYADDKEVGVMKHLSTPDTFVLTPVLSPGIHTLTIYVNNTLKYPTDQWNHGTTEYAQANWDGIVSDISPYAKERAHIRQTNAYPDMTAKEVEIAVQPAPLKCGQTGTLGLCIREKGGKVIVRQSINADSLQAHAGIRQTLPMGKQVKLWDEFTPYLYELEASWNVDGKTDTQTQTFGMRNVEQGKHHIHLNGRGIRLRGVPDCAAFPLTGYPSTNVDDWKRIFNTTKEYGMNHVRFHSWYPPEAASEAGNETGMHLQAELPMWIKDVGKYPARHDFFEKEMYAVLDAYGNHPSFILMCNGNENEGDFTVSEDLVKKVQAYDDRRLYNASTAHTHVPSGQYCVSHITSKGWVTVYEGRPSTDQDRCRESDIDVPVIAHETGQRYMYPNFEKIKKYTGVVGARNFEVFHERLARNGMLHQVDDFFKATGAHTVLQYKEANESLLRTHSFGDSQLLGLADFPGQGSAFVDILDAFWESKGLISPEEFRESCAPTVLLARLPQRTFKTGENLKAKMEIYHYGKNIPRDRKLNWTLIGEDGTVYRKGNLKVKEIQPATIDSLGIIELSLNGVENARKLTLKAELGNCRNEWDVWVYPEQPKVEETNFIYTRTWNDKIKQQLDEGKSVLLTPEKCQGRKVHFASHFWNPIMFNRNPMIVGTLIDNERPAFRDFPTGSYADWQWQDILNYLTALELDELKEITPLIQSIDSYGTNQKLGISFEANVGKGKLFVLCADPEKKIGERLAMQQLFTSVRNYVSSDRFKPERSLPVYQLDALFAPAAEEKPGNKGSKAIELLLNK